MRGERRVFVIQVAENDFMYQTNADADVHKRAFLCGNFIALHIREITNGYKETNGMLVNSWRAI
jgi:hypothetical protein